MTKKYYEMSVDVRFARIPLKPISLELTNHFPYLLPFLEKTKFKSDSDLKEFLKDTGIIN